MTVTRTLYDVKWPWAYDPNLEEHGAGRLTFDFDSPWGPPGPNVIAEFSRRYRASVTHYYSEAGMAFCGFNRWDNGTWRDGAGDDLKYGPEDEQGLSDIVGPAYILDHVSHYGG